MNPSLRLISRQSKIKDFASNSQATRNSGDTLPKYRYGSKDLVHFSFITFFIVMAALLADRYYLGGQETPLELSPEALDRLESESVWYGIYLKGSKIGYSRSNTTVLDSAIISNDYTFLSFSMMDSRQEVNSYSRAVTDTLMRLQSFVFSLTGQDTDYGVRGRVDGNVLNVVLNVAGESRGEQIEIDEPPQLPSTIQLLLDQELLESGGKFTTTVFDPSAMTNVPLTIEVLGDTSIEYRGAVVDVRRVREDMGGLEIISFIDSAGRVLEERSGMGYRLILEDEQTAMSGDWNDGSTDIQKLVAVTPDKPLPWARGLKSLTLEITGIGEDTLLLNGGPQSYMPPQLTIITSFPDSADAPVELLPEERAAALAPGSFVLSEHPRVVELAAEVVDLSSPAEVKIRAILDWLRDNIEQKPTFSIPNTLEVMQRRSGDCNEFAVMFASLARAAGIPTRIAMGLVYVDDAFYYHAWCECYLGHWVSVDPIFGQFPSDASHVRFIAGSMDRQVEILPLIGKVGLKIQDSETGLGSMR
jgi:hypothetical protein